MKIKVCRCFMCKYGLRHSKKEKDHVKYICRAARSKVKRLIKQEEFDKLPESISVPYIG